MSAPAAASDERRVSWMEDPDGWRRDLFTNLDETCFRAVVTNPDGIEVFGARSHSLETANQVARDYCNAHRIGWRPAPADRPWAWARPLRGWRGYLAELVTLAAAAAENAGGFLFELSDWIDPTEREAIDG